MSDFTVCFPLSLSIFHFNLCIPPPFPSTLALPLSFFIFHFEITCSLICSLAFNLSISIEAKLFLYDHLSHSHKAAFAGVFVILLPFFVPNLFGPLGGAWPSTFSEWNAPKPMHEALLEGALQRQISDDQQIGLWSPLANQGWKPCSESPKLHFGGDRPISTDRQVFCYPACLICADDVGYQIIVCQQILCICYLSYLC
ncbi:hypothetical protein K1719_024253 [Acacia pycnantha]|nr:hypothetical protein K1719_024253 [Acacia pycnantha]